MTAFNENIDIPSALHVREKGGLYQLYQRDQNHGGDYWHSPYVSKPEAIALERAKSIDLRKNF